MLSTTTGLHLVLNSVVSWVPGLEISSVHGDWSNIILKQVRYQIPGVIIKASEFNLALDFSSLVHRKLCIHTVYLRDVSVQVKIKPLSSHTTQACLSNYEPNSTTRIILSTPYPLIIRRLTLHNMQVKVNHTNIKLHELSTGLIFREHQLLVKSTRISGLFVALPKAAPVVINQWVAMAIKLKNLSQSSLLKTLPNMFTKPFRSVSLLPTLPLNITIEDLNGNNLHITGKNDIWITRLRMQAITHDQYAELILLEIESSQGLLNASGNADWRCSKLPVHLIVNSILNIDPIKKEIVQLSISGSLRDELHTMIDLSGSVKAKLAINIKMIQLGAHKFALPPEVNHQLRLSSGGSARGSLKLRGDISISSQQVLVDCHISSLRWADLNIRDITLQGIILSGESLSGYLHLQIAQLQQRQWLLRQLIFTATGDEKQHQLTLIMLGKPKIAGQLQIQGHFDSTHQLWHGVLSQTSFTTTIGEILKRLVPKFQFQSNMQASGFVTGSAEVGWEAGSKLPHAKVGLFGQNIKISQIVPVPGKTWQVLLDRLILNAGFDKDQAHFNWLLKIASNGQCNGQLQVVHTKKKHNINGNINIQDISLALLKPLFGRGESVEGMLNAALLISGNTKLPQLDGQLRLEQLIIKHTVIPCSMTESRLTLNFSGTKLDLHGLISTKHGQVNIIGHANWNCVDVWQARIAASGNRMRITMPSIVQIVQLDISPNIVFEATPTLLTLNGKIDIPWMRIKVKDMSESTGSISSDEVLLDEQLKLVTMRAHDQSIVIPIITNLLVHVGNDVQINALGLKANLSGDLKVTQDQKRLGISGEIDIPSGYFQAYGQDLIITQGQLLFSGPIDQPYLNIQAIRDPEYTKDNVIAGVQVTGPVYQPILDVFSNPIKSQPEALSYLLKGHGIDEMSTDRNIMVAMLIRMGMVQSEQFLGKIGDLFGVTDLALDTQGSGDSSKVIFSGYIAPRLQVKYNLDIFDSLATLILHYRLMPQLYLEVVSGLNQALNLFYRFDF
ncbi:translocation/assembly module TamB domain-containing protein [Candidatus Palibaumannia cicadellinicola]|uniref:translocation/assembly module TamB domain-containing protein n=1 Tax=Candidatus Palibaumannia cicadellinicola TaxID=186490 RepID=UPI0021A8E0B0|nr:translocation/assembly module TamB domain-containing protein [Candidatus Baumannia cicadellinicola]